MRYLEIVFILPFCSCFQSLIPALRKTYFINDLRKVSIHRSQILRTKMTTADCHVDVAVIGAGIGGTTVSWLLQEKHNVKVAMIDPNANNANTSWYPNYGEWRDEWHSLSERLGLPEMKECTTTEWEYTDCFFGGNFDIPDDQRLTLPRPYIRVDRIKLQSLMRSRLAAAGGLSISGRVPAKRLSGNLFDGGISHDKDGTIITLDNGQTIRCKTVIDATGAESRLLSREDSTYAYGVPSELKPGYQIAYGFIAVIDHLGPYDSQAMTLFDYRTTFVKPEDSKQLKDISDRPTFMYVMPLRQLPDGRWRVFFEETSLVGRDARRLTFQECKDRAYQRLAHYNITVFGVEEEEYCYIPMGGPLPDLSQRIVAFGAAANMVHPSTGYQVCRMMAASTDVASAISEALKAGKSADQISVDAYAATWSPNKRLQRDFQVFGGDFLMAQPVKGLRGFFSAFFALDQPVWSGFLAGYPGLPSNEYHDSWSSRLSFALSMFFNMPNEVRLSIALYAVAHVLEYGPNVLLRSVLPTFIFGSGPPEPKYVDPEYVLGDGAAKDEARQMMKAFTPTAEEQIPLYFDTEKGVLPPPYN